MKHKIFVKLRTKFIILFTSVLIFVFLLMIFIIQCSAKEYIESDIENSIFSLQSNIDEGVTEVVDEATYMFARMVKEENAALFETIGNGRTYGTRNLAFRELVQNAEINYHYFLDVGWKDSNGFISLNGFTSPADDVYNEAKANANKLIIGGYKNGSIMLAIYMETAVTEIRGTFVFYLMESVISDVYALLNQKTGYSFIMRSDGFIFSHGDKTLTGKTLVFANIFSLESNKNYQVSKIDGTKKIIAVSGMSALNEKYGFDCYLINVMDYNYYYSRFYQLIYILFFAAGIIFVLGIILAVIRAKRITLPVEKLNNAIDEVIRTDSKSKNTAKKGDEIYQLEQKYDEMISRIFNLMQKNREEMEIQRKLELDALQMQINPHFLYNTLDAVVWMAKIKKEPEIESLVVNLAKFFRLSLRKGDKFITVSEEVDIVRHYLEIEKIRFPEKVNVCFDVQEEISNYKTLKLILQPIVENTVKYAFPEQSGNLKISVFEKERDIIFEIEDDGVGFKMSENILKKGGGKNNDSGYGLYNVNERIALEYGEGYGITVSSAENKGTKVIIKIQKRI